MVNAKHLATFVLGAAAGVALHKYLQTEEGEKALADLKDKAPEYFEKLKTEGAETLKQYFPGAEKFLQDLFGKGPENPTPPPSEPQA